MSAIRQKLRPAMACFGAVRGERGQGHRRTASRRNAHQRISNARSKDNYAFTIPRPPIAWNPGVSRRWQSIQNRLHGPTGNRDLLELLVREKSDILPVR